MRAWLLPRPGSWRDMVLGEVPEPSPTQGEIRVAVHAVGLNPVDYKIARTGHPDWRFPHIVGLDVAGVVDAIGPPVSRWQPGDRVFYHGDLSKPGAFADLAVTTAHTVACIPDGMSFVDAASLPCAGLTRITRCIVGCTFAVASPSWFMPVPAVSAVSRSSSQRTQASSPS